MGTANRDNWIRLPVERQIAMSDIEDLEKITSIYSTLYPYQKEKLLSDLENCTILNNACRSYCIKVCPKCGSETPTGPEAAEPTPENRCVSATHAIIGPWLTMDSSLITLSRTVRNGIS